MCSQFVIRIHVACIKVLCIYMLDPMRFFLHFLIFFLTLRKFNMKPFQNMMVSSRISMNFPSKKEHKLLNRSSFEDLSMARGANFEREQAGGADGAPCDGKLSKQYPP